MDKQQLIHILDIILYEAEQEEADITVYSHLKPSEKAEALVQAIGFIMENM